MNLYNNFNSAWCNKFDLLGIVFVHSGLKDSAAELFIKTLCPALDWPLAIAKQQIIKKGDDEDRSD